MSPPHSPKTSASSPLLEPAAPPPPATATAAPEQAEDKPDYVLRNGKLYEKKTANLPFLKSHKWPAKPSPKESDSKKGKDKGRDSKMQDEKQGSPPPYQRASEVSRSILRYSVVLVLGTLLISRMVTETWTFGYTGKWTNVMNYVPRPMKTFSELDLMQYDGSDPALPIYLAIDGNVYDVSDNSRMYGKGASYNHFAGRDAARAFVTGCFKKHLTHDVRGFNANEQKALDGWKSFFDNHAKYYKVGRVTHEPIDPNSPLPEPCDPKAEGGAR